MPTLESLCPVCQIPFTVYQRRDRQQVCCSAKCAAQHRWRGHVPKPRGTVRRYPGVCLHCGRPYVGKAKTTRYCSRRCSCAARWATQTFRDKVKAFRRTDRQRQVASERMKRLNRDPSIREKTTAKLRGRCFSGARGGNGQLTSEQLLLAKALGWPTEHSIPTGDPSWRCATVDLALPELRVAVECDGASHRTRKQKNRDRRKERILAGLGWVVLRFWNAEITGALERVIAQVQTCVQARSSELSRKGAS